MPTCSWVPIILSSMTHPLSSTVGILGTSEEDSAKNNLKGGLAGWLGQRCLQPSRQLKFLPWDSAESEKSLFKVL